LLDFARTTIRAKRENAVRGKRCLSSTPRFRVRVALAGYRVTFSGHGACVPQVAPGRSATEAMLVVVAYAIPF
jgi:hypothetical protein